MLSEGLIDDLLVRSGFRGETGMLNAAEDPEQSRKT